MPNSTINDRLSRLDAIQVELLRCGTRDQFRDFFEGVEMLYIDVRSTIKTLSRVNNMSEEKITQDEHQLLISLRNDIGDENIDYMMVNIRRKLSTQNQNRGIVLLNEINTIFNESKNEVVARINKIIGISETSQSIKKDEESFSHFNEFKNVLDDAIHDKVRKTASSFTFRDKTLERERNDTWIALAHNLNDERYNNFDSAMELFSHAIVSNYNLTIQRFIEKNKKFPTDKQLDLGKIYKKTANKLYELSPEKFKQVIAASADTLRLPNLEVFFKSLRSDGKALTVDMVFSKQEQAALKNNLTQSSGFAWKP